MKLKELKALSEKEMGEKKVELQKELLKLRGQIAVGTIPKSPGQVKNLRKTIAKIIHLNSIGKTQGANSKKA